MRKWGTERRDGVTAGDLESHQLSRGARVLGPSTGGSPAWPRRRRPPRRARLSSRGRPQPGGPRGGRRLLAAQGPWEPPACWREGGPVRRPRWRASCSSPSSDGARGTPHRHGPSLLLGVDTLARGTGRDPENKGPDQATRGLSLATTENPLICRSSVETLPSAMAQIRAVSAGE